MLGIVTLFYSFSVKSILMAEMQVRPHNSYIEVCKETVPMKSPVYRVTYLLLHMLTVQLFVLLIMVYHIALCSRCYVKWVNHDSLVSKGRGRNILSLNGSLNLLFIQIVVKLQVKSEFLSEINFYGQEVNIIDNSPSQSYKNVYFIYHVLMFP